MCHAGKVIGTASAWHGTNYRDVYICQPAAEARLVERLYERRPRGQRGLYLSLFDRTVQLRPGVELRAYIRKGLYDQMEP